MLHKKKHIIPKHLREHIFTIQRGICLRCGKPLDKVYHVHHIDRTGQSDTPNNDPENLCALHPMCHNVIHLRFPVPGKGDWISLATAEENAMMETYIKKLKKAMQRCYTHL
jgi:hypothetical protein